MDIESCPKCQRPRAIGYRCPSCGEAPTIVNDPPATPGDVGTWRPDASSWKTVAKPNGIAGPYGMPASSKASSAGKSRKGLIATVIIGVLVIAAAAVAAVMLFTDGAAVVQEEAAVAAAPQKAFDEAAQSLLRNAMTAMDSAFVESADYKAITQTYLETMEPAIKWKQGRSRTCISPPQSAKAQQNGVAWISTGRMSYELGTLSASGASFGVKVDKTGGGVIYYKNGEAAAW